MARNETHDLGRLYTHGMSVPRGGPLVELGTSHEVEEPWRVGRCVVLRVWKWAAVVGWWGPARTLAEMLRDEGDEAYEIAVAAEEIREGFRPQPVETPVDEWQVR